MTTWNKYMENILKKWSSTAKTYSIMHSISAQYYSTWNKRLGIPAVVLGAAASSSIFTTSSKNDADNIWAYINGCLVLLATGLTGVSKFLGVTEKQVKHTSASFKYTNISMNIDTVLSFPRRNREEDPRQFINEIKMAILEVREHSPDLPTWVVSNYINKLNKSLINTQTKVNRREHENKHTKYHQEQKDPYRNLRKLNDWNETYKSSSSGKSDSNHVQKEQKEQKEQGQQSKPKNDYEEDPEEEPLKPIKPSIKLKQIRVIVEGEKEPSSSKTEFSDDYENIYTDFLDPMSEKVAKLSTKFHCDTDPESSEEE